MIPFVILAIETDEDRAYMTRLYQQESVLMYKIAWEFVSQQSDVDDIVSEICIALINKLDTVRTLSPAVLRSYIATTARNTAIDYVRKRKRYLKQVTLTENEPISQTGYEREIENRIILYEEVEQVLNALQYLSKRDQTVLRMKFFYGQSNTEIADAIQVSENVVRKVIERSRKRLKEIIYQGAVNEDNE